MPQVLIENATVSAAPPPQQWKTFYFNVQSFSDLPTTTGHYFSTPEFSCNGHDWRLYIYPGGDEDAGEGYVSIFLNHHWEGEFINEYELMIIDNFGKKKKAFKNTDYFKGGGKGKGCNDFIKHSDILDESNNLLDRNGALTVAVSIKEDRHPIFVPKNPFQKMVLNHMFLNEDTADICFEVISSPEAIKGRKKKAKASQIFHAHHLILKMGAPMLANLFDLEDDDGKIATATINDIKPAIFRHVLCYVYGGSVPEEYLKTHAKAIIEAADKYSIVNLKLEAEAAYVKFTIITIDNAMDNLLYADAKNCALLKEAVMKFLVENCAEASREISFTDFPGHAVKDLLLAVCDNFFLTADEAASDNISALRRILEEKGLDIDGSREAMIESIKNNS